MLEQLDAHPREVNGMSDSMLGEKLVVLSLAGVGVHGCARNLLFPFRGILVTDALKSIYYTEAGSLSLQIYTDCVITVPRKE